MGAIVQWIITHAQRIAAWGMIVVSVGSLLYALSQSGVYQQTAGNLSSFSSLVDRASSSIPTITGAMNTAMSDAINDGGGWVQLICYMVYLDGWGELTTLISANFDAILVSTITLGLACGTMAATVFLYTRKRLLANAVAGSPLAVT